MLKMTTIMLSIFLIVACNKEAVPTNTISIDFQEYVQLFEKEALRRDSTLSDIITEYLDTYSVTFDDDMVLSDNAFGGCLRLRGGDIVISKNAWDTLSYIEKEQLLFHELAHCILGRYHNSEVFDGQNRFFECKSLMHPILDLKYCLWDYHSPMWRTFYLDELFGVKEFPDWIGEGVDFFDETFESSAQMILNDRFNNVDLELDNNTQVEIFFNNRTTIDLQLGDYNLSMQYIGEESLENGRFSFKLDNETFAEINNLQGLGWESENDTKITFRIIDDILYLFIDERFIHSREVMINQIDQINILEDSNNGFERIIISEII